MHIMRYSREGSLAAHRSLNCTHDKAGDEEIRGAVGWMAKVLYYKLEENAEKGRMCGSTKLLYKFNTN